MLNFMCSGWIHDGIDMEWLTLGLNDVVPYPEDEILGIRANLAVRLAAQYEASINPALANMAVEGYHRLQRSYLNVPELGAPEAILPYNNANTGHTF
jgi:hypothetical protein